MDCQRSVCVCVCVGGGRGPIAFSVDMDQDLFNDRAVCAILDHCGVPSARHCSCTRLAATSAATNKRQQP